MKKRILLFAGLLFLIVTLPAQERHMLHWGVGDGLAGSTVYCSLQDRNGFMWFGTDQGLCRFDGANFKTYTVADGLSDNDVFWLSEDTKGRIWIICFNETPCYIENGEIHRFRLETGAGVSDSREFPSVVAGTPEGYVYILFPRAMLILDSALHISEKYTFSSNTVGLAYSKGFVMVAQHDSLFRISEGKKQLFFAAGKGGQIYSGLEIYHDRLYLNMSPITKGKIVSINMRDGKDLTEIYSNDHQILNFKFLGDSTLRFISDEMIQEVHLYDRQKSTSLFYGKSPSNIFLDKDSNTWISTLGNGIYMSPKNGVTVYEKGLGLHEREALSISGDGKGRIAVGYRYSDVDILDSGKVVSHIRYKGSNHMFRILSIKAKGDDFYLASDYTLMKIDRDLTISAVCPVEVLGHVKDFDFTKNGFLIANSNGALSLIFAPEVRQRHFLNERATSIAKIRDEYYAMGTITGLLIYDHGKVYKYNRDQALSSSRISDISVDSKGNTWVSTNQNGVFCINDTGVRNINVKMGLSSNLCKKLFIDEADNIWVCTNKGVNQIKNGSGTKSAIRIFDLSYGLPTDDINDVYVTKGNIWIATTQGVANFKEGTGNSKPLPIHILAFYAHDSLYRLGTQIDLSYLQNDIRVDYAGISFTGGHSVQYKYLLNRGKSVSDTILTTATSIRFGALSPGSYTLSIWSADNSNIWSDVPARISFRISPPVWQTLWFYISLSIILIVLIWLLTRMRIISIKKKEKDKAEVNKRISELELQALRAQMNPHFIFNALNSIQSFYANNDELTANKFMTTFSSLIRQILISSSKNLITIKDEIDMLTNYIELEKMRFKGKFDYRITLDKEIFAEKVYLPIMLIQPYVENAIHHGLRFGEDGLLSISFALDNKSLICTIEDNGIGLKASLAKKAGTASGHISAGMQITHDRIDSLNIIYEGRIGVSFIDRSEKDVKATGLTVRISLPVIDQNIQEL